DKRIPEDLATICLKAMSKEPNSRFTSAREMSDDLRRFANGEPILARKSSAARRVYQFGKRQPALTVTIIAAVTAVAATAWLGFRGVSDQRDLYRQERDRANQELYQSLLAQSEIKLRESESGWFQECLALLERAAAIRPPTQDVRRHRELTIEVLASEVPRFEALDSLTLHPPASMVAASPDGRWLAVCQPVPSESKSNDRILLYDANLARSPTKIRQPSGVCGQLLFGPDGQGLYATFGETLYCWQLDAAEESDGGVPIASIPLGSTPNCVAVSDTGSIVESGDGNIRVWTEARPGEWTIDRSIETGSAGVRHLQFQGASRVVAALDNALLAAYSLDTGDELHRFRHLHPMTEIISHSSRVFFLDGVSNRVHCLRAFTRETKSAIQNTRIAKLALVGDRMIAATRRGRLLHVNTSVEPLEIASSVMGPDQIVDVVGTRDHLYCAYADGSLIRWGFTDSQYVAGQPQMSQPLSVDSEGNFWSSSLRTNASATDSRVSFRLASVACCDVSKRVRVFARDTTLFTLDPRGVRQQKRVASDAIEFLGVFPDGRRAAVVSGRTLSIIRLSDFACLAESRLDADCTGLGCSNDRVIVGHPNQIVAYAATEMGENTDDLSLVVEFHSDCDASRTRLTVSGDLVLYTASDSAVQARDVQTWEPRFSIKTNGEPLTDIRGLPDGEGLFGLDRGGAVHLWASDGAPQSQFGARPDAVGIGVDPRGEFVVIATPEQILLYDASSGNYLGLFVDCYGIVPGAIEFEHDGNALWLANQRYDREELVACRENGTNPDHYEVLIPASEILLQYGCAVSRDGKWHARGGTRGSFMFAIGMTWIRSRSSATAASVISGV
ncbi:MAG: hypothetical protein AAFU85_31620, partial [Planctomycetota bacterium]